MNVIMESTEEFDNEGNNLTQDAKEDVPLEPFSEFNVTKNEDKVGTVTQRKSSKGFDVVNTDAAAASAAAKSTTKPTNDKLNEDIPTESTHQVKVEDIAAAGETANETKETSDEKDGLEVTLSIVSPFYEEREPEPKPITSDDEYDTDLEIEEPQIKYGAFGTQSYTEKCKMLNIVPVSYVLRNLQYEVLNIAHHGLGPQGTKALSVALVHNSTVTSLNIEDNGIGPLGGGYIAEMLTENGFITEINLANNQMGSQNLSLLCSALSQNSALVKVNLSNNGFKDRDAEHLVKIFTSEYIRDLNLSHNELGDRAAVLFGKALVENFVLTNLDLSWNIFRGRPAAKLIDGMKANSYQLKNIDISWNGISDVGAMALVRCIKNNPTITHIDASSNRITDAPVKLLGKAISNSQTLLEIRLASNQFKPASALMFLKALQNENCNLGLLDLSGTWVHKDFQEAYLDLLRVKPVTVLFAGVLENTERKGRILTGPLVASSLISLLDKYAALLVNEISKTDKASSDLLSHEDFKQCIREANIGLTEDQINRLVIKYDSGNADQMVNYRKMNDEL